MQVAVSLRPTTRQNTRYYDEYVVSMLPRIQSAPSEGDALFNLGADEWLARTLVVTPLPRNFASLLFVLFAGGILRRSVFPLINPPRVTAPQTIQVDSNQSKPADQQVLAPSSSSL